MNKPAASQKNPRPRKKNSSVWHRYLGPLVFFMIPVTIILIALDVISNKPAIRHYCAETENFITQNQAHLETLFSTTFDRAQTCTNIDCIHQNNQEIVNGLEGEENLMYFPSTYFIRLGADNEIQKLFLSGNYKLKKAETWKEDMVVKLLEGKRGRICDQGYKIDVNTTTMTYLNDLEAEAEIIIPVKKDGKVVGAVVRWWGD